jgi:hypothetical protein
MSGKELFDQALARACLNDAEAMSFLRLWSGYVHGIDDLIDEPGMTNEAKIGLFIQALQVYNHPFYLKHRTSLNPIIIGVTNLYADSVAWEKSPDAWKQAFSDWARHAGAEMVLAVANLAGGYAHMRRISLELRTVNYCEHHNEKGERT